ncbi:MAG: ferredoxin reductase family protein [Deferrisomatales bacterium]|nr:ferredoxin reductase family protein [Deferrisomatales bacterium]
MNYILRGIFWISVYVLLVTAPLFALLIGSAPAGRGFWWDLHVALGFSGATMMGMMFFLTARFRRAAGPFGMDIIYYFHRWTAVVALAFVAAHVVLVFAVEPGYLVLLDLSAMPASLRTGIGSATALAVLVGSSLGRQHLGIGYDLWRLWHVVFAVAALTLAIVHMELVGYHLGTPWKRWLWAGMGLSWFGAFVYVRIVKPFFMYRRPYRVVEVRRERGSAWTLVAEPVGHRGLTFLPGQFAWVTIGHSPFALKEHPFSFSSSAARPGRLEFTIKELGDFTRRIKDVQPGQPVYVDGPHGSFSPDRHDAAGYVFIAGGIGIAPILSMLRTLADRGDRRPLLLIYAGKTLEVMTGWEEIQGLQQRLNLQVVPVPENPPEGWEGLEGFLNEAKLVGYLPDHRSSREYFVCGPVPLTQLIEKALYRQRVPLENVHSELFDLV